METSNEFCENDRRCRPSRRNDVGVRRRHCWNGRDVPDLFRTDARSASRMIDVTADAWAANKLLVTPGVAEPLQQNERQPSR
jgi:hypothetical protein